MKNKIKFLTKIFITVIVFSVLQSCRKYADGPLISFHSRTERLANTWVVNNYSVNDVDYTYLLSGYTETFTRDGNFYYTFRGLSGTGSWTFENNETEVRIIGIDHQASESLFIIKLAEKQLWYYYLDGNDRKEYHMTQL